MTLEEKVTMYVKVTQALYDNTKYLSHSLLCASIMIETRH